ncbi:microtubule integrity protein mal3 [Coemansia erecta]|nr:microtubule integrity protein mal3 [Coemansia erecta]
MDSIYGDVKLDRVKFNANQEYEYIENYKILQNVFAKHKIDKPLNPTRLVKCRFQDNFELLQWFKRFWDSYSSGMPYDALGRRNGKPAGPVDAHRPMSSASSARSSSAGAYRARPGPQGAARAGARPLVGAAARGAAVRPGSRTVAGAGSSQQQVQDLGRQLGEAKAMIETAEKERDFYFLKLREIEVYLQSNEFVAGSELEAMAKHIQGILYSTDEGDVEGVDAGQMDDHQEYDQVSGHMNSLHVDEEETF